MNRIFIVLLTLVAVACRTATAPPDDTALRGKLIGTWSLDREAGGVSMKGYVTLAADGMLTGAAVIKREGKLVSLSTKGQWEVKGGVLIETVTCFSDRPPVRLVTYDTIVSVDENAFTYKTETGVIVTRKRQK